MRKRPKWPLKITIEMEHKMREAQRIYVSSSSNKESSSDDEISFEKLSKMIIEEHVSPVRDLEEEVPIEEDPRQLAYKDFVSNDEFVMPSKFKSFLYKIKGKTVRESVGEVNVSNENQLLVTLKGEVEEEMSQMTLRVGGSYLRM